MVEMTSMLISKLCYAGSIIVLLSLIVYLCRHNVKSSEGSKQRMVLNIISDRNLPEYKTSGAAGFDLEADIDSCVSISPGERKMIPTGIRFEIPEGYEIQIRGRSGLAKNYGICLADGIGTIDSDYRGELYVLLINLGVEPFDIHPGDRIAQAVVNKIEMVDFNIVTELTETTRGHNGFGHTGV